MDDYMPLMTPKGDVGRLPKWAQTYIASLVREIWRLREQVTAVSSPHPGSNVRVWGGCTSPDITLPPDSQIQFYMGDGPYDERLFGAISVYHKPGYSDILYLNGGSMMNISPRSGNSIEVSIDGH